MERPRPREEAETRTELERWLSSTFPGVSVSNIRGPAATGYSHETIIFDVQHAHGTESMVARVEPTTHTVFLDSVFEHEYRVMDELSRAGGRVPRIRAFESDPSFLGASFFLMEHVDGVIPSDNPPYTFGGWLAEAAPADQTRAWWSGFDAMTQVHLAEWQSLDLAFLRRGVAGELEYASRMFEWTTTDAELPQARAALEWLHRTRPPEPETPALCWGDARLGNQIFRDFECVALLDWEMAAIADPEEDLGWWLYFDRVFSEGLGVPRPAGFPTHTETVARYEASTGRRVRHLAWYQVFAAFRFSVVMLRLGMMMKASGQLPEDSDFHVNNFAVDMMVRVLDEAAAVPATEE